MLFFAAERDLPALDVEALEQLQQALPARRLGLPQESHSRAHTGDGEGDDTL